MKKFISRLLGKLSLCAIMILLQFGWLTYVVYRATVLSQVFNTILHALAIVLALYVVNKDLKPYYKLSWCFLILCLPIFGCTGYFLFGRSGLSKRKGRQLESVIQETSALRNPDPSYIEPLVSEDHIAQRIFSPMEPSAPEDCVVQKLTFPGEPLAGEDRVMQKTSSYIMEYAGFPVYREEQSEYFSSGEAAFPRMLEDLRQARRYIFLEYFIIAPGKMFDSMLEILEQKVAEGIEVRLIYDDFGSINTLSPRFDKILESKGIRCLRFNPFRPVLSVVMNNRDHRKILVVDGRIAYTGGINLADEYINEYERFGYWKDEAIRLEGACSWSFAVMFLEMWNYIAKSTEDYGLFFPAEESRKGTGEEYAEDKSFVERMETHRPCGVEGVQAHVRAEQEKSGWVQPFGDSPLDQEDVSENVYLDIINGACHYVYIFTPYLILSWEMNRAMVNAAKTGVDVRIVTPGMPDKRLVYLLTQANYESLLRGGVKIYTYKPGFIHSKCIVSDNRYAVVGTINLDFRSLYLHFECGVFLCRARAVMQVYQDAVDTFEQCHQVSLEECEDKNLFHQLLLSILQLFSPLL